MARIKVLLDTNVLLYMVNPRSEHAKAITEIIKLANENKLTLFVGAHSLKDFYYISTKAPYALNDAEKRNWIAFFLESFVHVDLTSEIQKSALAGKEPDFEDGVIRACAESSSCNFIVSYDAAKSAFASETCKKVTAEGLCKILAETFSKTPKDGEGSSK